MTKPATETSSQSAQQTGSERTAIDLSQRSSGGGALDTSHGRTSIADAVVSKIAGIATREVSGVHDLGRGSARAFGQIKQRIPGSSGPAVSQGVSVEVGETQTAIDLDVVVDYGVAIADLAKSIRRNVITSVERMTGLEVVEVNISVDDVFIPGDDSSGEEQQAPSRVQ